MLVACHPKKNGSGAWRPEQVHRRRSENNQQRLKGKSLRERDTDPGVDTGGAQSSTPENKPLS